MISVGDAINEPRYPSLKAIMGAKKKPLETYATADVGIEAGQVGESGSKTQVLAINPPPEKEAGRDHRGRGHERDGREDRRLARRKEADLMAGILVYALHDDEGNFNKNSLGAISEAAKLAGELGSEAAAVVVGEVADDACAGARRLRGQQGLPGQVGPRGPRPADRRRDGQGDRRRGLLLRAVRRRAARASRSAPG